MVLRLRRRLLLRRLLGWQLLLRIVVVVMVVVPRLHLALTQLPVSCRLPRGVKPLRLERVAPGLGAKHQAAQRGTLRQRRSACRGVRRHQEGAVRQVAPAVLVFPPDVRMVGPLHFLQFCQDCQKPLKQPTQHHLGQLRGREPHEARE
uniref:Putative secreted protein n=1 Tax=Ixodes ricinus TaxID=34613 RepID=A0A6B0UVJ7_IXORI